MDEPKLALYQYEKICDEYPEAKYNKAIAYYRLSMYEDAIKVLKEIVDSNGSVSNAHYLLVELLFSLGRIKDGMVYLNKAIDTHGTTPNIHYLKGVAYSHQKNWLGAYSEFLSAVPGYIDNPKIYLKMGIAAENIGQTEKAIQHLKEAVRLKDEDKFAVIELIKILVKYKIIADKTELRELMKEYDKETVEMALSFYDSVISEEEE
jgi:tetratricopeptide (TPR) repeat protein